jgi:hypothetical protein
MVTYDQIMSLINKSGFAWIWAYMQQIWHRIDLVNLGSGYSGLNWYYYSLFLAHQPSLHSSLWRSACCPSSYKPGSLSLDAPSFILEGDFTIVTLALQNPSITQDWRIASIVSHIHSLIPTTTSWSASSVNRSANFCAHHVANWAATWLHSFLCFWFLFPLIRKSCFIFCSSSLMFVLFFSCT